MKFTMEVPGGNFTDLKAGPRTEKTASSVRTDAAEGKPARCYMKCRCFL